MGFNLRRGITQERKIENAIESKSNPVNPVDLNRKTVCITGTIPGMTRLQAQVSLKKRFPSVYFSESLTQSTDYLITGFGCGQSKLTKAKSYSVIVIDSSKFFS